MRRKDGSTFPSEHTVKPLTIEDDQCKSHVCVVRDISEQVKREEDLSNLAQEFVNRNAFVESVITNLKSGIIVVDHDYRIVMLNPYAAEFSGESPELFIGKYLSEICPELQAALVSGLFVGEIPVTLFNKLQIIGYSKFDLMDNFVDSSGYIINFKELTEITKIRKELRHKDRLSAMGEVVANVAHELRNPLFAMTTVAQILEMELVLQPAQKELMDSLLKEGRRLNNIVEELLQSTKEIRLKKTRVELNSIVAQSFNVLNPIALRRKIDLKVNSFAVEIYLHSDFEKIEQVLINLLDNAMEASPEGSEVNLSIEEEVGGVVISVSDCGEGIVQDAFDKIFEVFYTTKTRGTGLGLSICRNIVDAHGGTLEARNNSDRGATFTITLPFGNDVS